MESHSPPIATTAASSVNRPTIASCQMKKSTETARVKAMFIQPIRQTAASARSDLPAPRFCPTSVAAALDMPQAGISVNIMMRIAIVAPATASVDTLARMRIRKIHAVIATIIWPMPPSDVRTICNIVAPCQRRATRAMRRRSLPAHEDPQLHRHAGAAAQRGGDRGPFDAHGRDRPQAEDEDRIEHDVQRVRHPQHTHRRRCIARAAEDRVDDEQQQDDHVAAEHPLHVAVAVLHHPVVPAHQPQQILCEEDAGERERDRDQHRQCPIACTAEMAASSARCSPMRRATIAVTAIARPMAIEYSRNR